ncbi:hypothetical protein RvY_09763 [Ramazzottius varieornatus]|uniref:Exoribonuclease phosphorolytic domain-containing protein n=1 Tax=Ramazzottius varieornatus TaxID=947166 RepID=A0A1D1VAI6_RAMVA|nr:hypothetical protein RvY_09763 [Ramazzottius varieornatus]
MANMEVDMEEAKKTGRALVPADCEPAFVRRDGGSSLFKCGDNASTTLVGLPQRGPSRQDGLTTLQVTYSFGLVARPRRVKKIGSVNATKATLKTAQDMLILRPMAKSRIRLKVCSVQSGPSEAECAVNSTSMSLLQSSYDLKDVIAAVVYTKSASGEDVFFPSDTVLHDSRKCRRPVFRLRFNVTSQVIWMSISGPSTVQEVRKAEEVCRAAASTIFQQMRHCAAGK